MCPVQDVTHVAGRRFNQNAAKYFDLAACGLVAGVGFEPTTFRL